MKKIVYITALLSLTLLLAGCEDFLSAYPTKSTNQPIKHVEQLEALLNNPNVTSGYDTHMQFCTDDTEYTDEFSRLNPNTLGPTGNRFFTFDVEGMENESNSYPWTMGNQYIFIANTIIENADIVEGDPVLKARVKAEAYFLRAINMWEMANVFCLPYAEENMDEPGLPLRLTTSMEESLVRATLRDTYARIEADIEEALKIDKTVIEVPWRVSKAGINAFLTRYYLHKGDYAGVITAAETAMANKGVSRIKDYNTEITAGVPVNYGAIYDSNGNEISPAVTLNYSMMFSSYLRDWVHWEEFFYIRNAVSRNQWVVPSQSLMSLYDHDNDMRFKWFFVANRNRRMNVSNPATYGYVQYGDGTGFISGPTIQEVMLNKAEALVRGSSQDVAGAMALVNELRMNRLAPGTPGLELTAANAEQALALILEERRREMPFVHRWWDIRRFAYNETTADDVTVVHNYYEHENGVLDLTKPITITVPPKSRLYAIPILGTEIDSSNGQIVQNTY